MVITARALRSQQKAMPVIGYLNAAKPLPITLDEFGNGLAENGYHEGQNVLIEYRSAEGQYDRLPAMAAELVRRPVDVIVAIGGGISGRVAKAATNTIPIVALMGGDQHAGAIAPPGVPGLCPWSAAPVASDDARARRAGARLAVPASVISRSHAPLRCSCRALGNRTAHTGM
jgi:ABC transporter substrate binding protein